jgi:hypothetical protein
MSGIPVPGHHVMQIIKQDKNRLIIEITGSFTIYQGKRANVIYIRDITERKIAEDLLSASEANTEDYFRTFLSVFWK